MAAISSIEIEKESVVVLYEARMGNVLHVHHVVTVKGGKHPDDETIERDARAMLTAIQPKVLKDVLSLHVPPDSLQPGHFFKVDPEKRTLIELSLKERPRRARWIVR